MITVRPLFAKPGLWSFTYVLSFNTHGRDCLRYIFLSPFVSDGK